MKRNRNGKILYPSKASDRGAREWELSLTGYTRLVESDRDGTVAAWQAARSDIIEPSITDQSGNIVKNISDGFLAEFPNVQDAVQCATTSRNNEWLRGDITGNFCSNC